MPDVRVFYDLLQDMYVVEFWGDPIFEVPDEENHWAMIIHGVCTDAALGTLKFYRIGIPGWHLCSHGPTEKSLGERLDQARRRRTFMCDEAPKGHAMLEWMLRCRREVELLTEKREEII